MNNIFKFRNIVALVLSLAIFLTSVSHISLVSGNETSDTDSVEQVSDSGITLVANLYNDAGRTDLRTALTAEGSECEDWTYETDLYLGIALDGLPMTGDDRYQLVIEMAPILYLNQNSEPELAHTTVSYVQNQLTVNTDYSYPVKTYSLSELVYTVDKGTGSLNFGLPLRFDTNLWDKRDGSELGDETTPLLRVYVQKVGEEDSVVGCDLKLMQITADGAIAIDSVAKFYDPDTNNESSTLGVNDDVRLNIKRSNDTNYSGGYIYNNLKIVITLPSCTIDETKHIFEYSVPQLTIAGGSLIPDVTENDGVLTVTAENLYYNNGSLMNLLLTVPDSIESIEGTHTFIGKVSVYADEKVIFENLEIRIPVDNNKVPDIKTYVVNGTANILRTDNVQFLGNLAIRNDAAEDNGSGLLYINYEFDQNNTNLIGVTTVNLMCDRDTEIINIKYTLVDKDGNLYTEDGKTEFEMNVKNKHYAPASSETTNKFQRFTRNDLPAAHQEYYFKTITYTIGNLDGNTKAYQNSANKSPSSGGTFWGYLFTDQIPENKPVSKMTVSGNKIETLSAVSTVNIDKNTTVSYGLQNPKISADEIDAGNYFTISGNVFVISYPYTSNTCLDDIRLGLLLPEGVSVNEASINAYGSNNYKFPVNQVTKKELGSGKNFWTIEFESGQQLGYYNESLGTIKNGGTLRFSMQLDTNKEMSTQTIVLRDSVFVAGDQIVNGAGGSYSSNSYTDYYDLNNNSKTSDKIGSFGKNDTDSITINASPAALDITDTLRKDSGLTGSELTLDSFADTVYYDLNIACTKGGSAEDFQYYIPVAKNTYENEDSFLVGNGISSEDAGGTPLRVELKMKGPAALTTSSGTELKVLYTTDELTAYSDGATANWLEKDEVTDWSKVTMLKIVSSEASIANGTVNTISVPLGYLGEDTAYEHYAGVQIVWKSRGFYNYTLGSNSSSGTKSTEGCELTLVYTPEKPIEFTLTAAKDRNPQGTDATNIYSFTLPQFILAQKYSIKEIKATNVTLVDKDYDFAGTDSVKANTDFRITVSVDDAADETPAQDAVDIKENGTIVGSHGGNTTPTFTFELYNADELSDIVTARYVELTLIGDNGVIVPVKINIAREMAAAEPAQSAILAGKIYVPFNDAVTEIELSQNSAFTAQFVTNDFIPVNYKNTTLDFSEKPINGTTITMIDWTDNSDLRFYHYEFNSESDSSIPLTDFIEMGGSNHYQESDSTDSVKETLLFIVQYPLSGEKIMDESDTLKLSRTLISDNSVSDSGELKYKTVEKREFSLSAEDENGDQASEFSRGESFVLSYTSECSLNNDSRYSNRNLSILISPEEGKSLPDDAVITIGDNKYHLNSSGNIIIPLDAVWNGNDDVTIAFSTAVAGDIKLNATLYASATSAGLKPMLGEAVTEAVPITLKDVVLPSFRVESMSNRLIYRADLSNIVTVDYNYLNATNITVEIQKKIGSGYVTQTNILESVNGNQNHSQGVFDVSLSKNSVELKLSATSPNGTYRILFTANGDGGTVTVPYNLIILE